MARTSFVTTAQLAQAFRLSSERIRQLTKDGMPSEAPGSYDYVSASVWYIRFLQEAVKRRETPGGVGGADALRRERAAAMEMDTELKRIELRRARAELVPVDRVVVMFEDAMGVLKAKMLAAVRRAGGRLMAAKSERESVAVVEEVVLEAVGAMGKVGSDYIGSANGSRNGTAR